MVTMTRLWNMVTVMMVLIMVVMEIVMVVNDFVDSVSDGQFDTDRSRACGKGGHRIAALCQHRIRCPALTKCQSISHVTGMRPAATEREGTRTRKAVDRFRLPAKRGGKPPHLGQSARDDSGARIVTKTKAGRTSRSNGNHILQPHR